MSIYRIKSGFRSDISQFIRIDEWDLDVPRNLPRQINGVWYPASSAVMNPIQNVTVIKESTFQPVGQADISSFVCWRFAGKSSINALPIAEFENLWEFYTYRIVTYPGSIHSSVKSARLDNTEIRY